MTNDHDPLTALDRRAAAAAAEVRASADGRTRPLFDQAHATVADAPASLGGRPAPRRAWAVAAAALAVAVLGAALWTATRDEGEADPIGVTTDPPRPYVLGEVPEALDLALAAEAVPEPAGDDGSLGMAGPLHVFGPGPEEPELGVLVLDDDVSLLEAEGLPADVDVIDVDGRRAAVLDGWGIGDATVVVEVDGVEVALAGAPLGIDRVLRLAGAVSVVDGRPVLPPEAIPDGWRELGVEPGGLLVASAVAAGRGTPMTGSFVTYLASDTETGGVEVEPMVTVASQVANPLGLELARVVAADVRRSEVGGRPATIASLEVGVAVGLPSELVIVSWMPVDGELVRMTAAGYSVEEAVALAESVEPADPEAWDELVEQTLLGDVPLGGGAAETEVARGRFDDGTAWVLRSGDPSGADSTSVSLHVALRGDSAGSSASSMASIEGAGDGDTPIVAYELLEQAGRRFLAGVASPEGTEVVVRGADGAELDRAEVAEEPLRWFVLELDDGWATVALLDDQGDELTVMDREIGERGLGDLTVDPDPGRAPAPTTTVVGGPGD